MRIPAHTLDQIREATDLAQLAREYGIRLQRVAGGYVARCPFHTEKTASFRVHTQGERRNLYKCFGCSRAGGALNLVMELENLSFPEAARLLADRAGITIETGRTDAMLRAAEREDAAFAAWVWQRRWEATRSALDTEYGALMNEYETDASFAWTCSRLLLAIEAMTPAEKVQNCHATAAERAEWAAEVAENQAFTLAWMSLAREPMAA